MAVQKVKTGGLMITPYYETDNGKLYHGDCLDIMLELDPVDLILTDPPYGTSEMVYSKNISRGKLAKTKDYGEYVWDNKIPGTGEFYEMKKISKNQIIFGGNYFVQHLYASSCWIVWDKLNGLNDFADCELAWTSFTTAVRKYTWRWKGMIQEKSGQYRELRVHPNQKPTGLFVAILRGYSGQNELTLDPYLGSGTTAIACERLNRRWIGIEISKEYCDIAVDRIKKETAQYKMAF